MPTTYPKCSPSEMMGLLVLLDSHKGQDDVARLADDLDLEIDEILPSLDFAEALDLIDVEGGQATFASVGRQLIKGSIRERKAILRDQLRRTPLFRTLMRALESAPGHCLSGDELSRIIEFTTAPSEEAVQNIVNWGRYVELFRYDADERRLVAIRRVPPRNPPGTARGPSTPALGEGASITGSKDPASRTLPLAVASG